MCTYSAWRNSIYLICKKGNSKLYSYQCREREPSNRLKVIGKYPYDWEFFEYQCIVDVSKVIYQTVIHL